MYDRSILLLFFFLRIVPSVAIFGLDRSSSEQVQPSPAAAYRPDYDSTSLPQLQHDKAKDFQFGRFQSPDAVEKAFRSCRSSSAFKLYRGKDGRTGQVCSTKLGGDWVLAESKQIAPSCTAADVLIAYLNPEIHKKANGDKIQSIQITCTGPGEYRQDVVLKSQRVITSHTGTMRYMQTIRVDQIGSGNYNAFVKLDPDAKSNTLRRPFDALAVNVSLRQVQDDVHIYAAGLMRVNRRVVPNLILFDASGIAGSMAGKGTLWLSSYFEKRRNKETGLSNERESQRKRWHLKDFSRKKRASLVALQAVNE